MPYRSEKKLDKSDLRDASQLYDHVHGETVDVVSVHVGCVYLRWPHQRDRTHEDKIPDDSHIESESYHWPLDGHRFEIQHTNQ